ncbi:MAG: DUF4954 family protein [Spirochaetales bacterium]|nr:DUF4954 family protein [Spirochaetales bacterium]
MAKREQETPGPNYRKLTDREITLLEQNNNRAEKWETILVADPFDPSLVQNCRFEGSVRIGKVENHRLERDGLSLPCGLYNSTIISCELGNRVALHHVHYLSRYILEDQVLLLNIDEMSTTAHPRFGNGTPLETANEKGGRTIQAYEGMLPGDGWLWCKYRDKKTFTDSFPRWTERDFTPAKGSFGLVGSNSLIKGCRVIKDVRFGKGSLVSGANRLENLTLASTAERPVSLGEGTVLCHGIVGPGARVSPGVQAHHFLLDEETRLEHGARFINSFLGANSTVACCEVQNALLFPFHEQHHNNSFLIASVLQGQSNIAAGATIGSNHNSRSPDGEILAGRGFWPGLNVSLKHNSRFAPFTLIAKGSYPAELNIPLPFSLLSRDESRNLTRLMPAYWFRHNMYALARNSAKFRQRDKRPHSLQNLEFHFLAPDSMEAVREGRLLLEKWCGKDRLNDPSWDPEEFLLEDHNLEKSRRPVALLRPARAWAIYGKLIGYYFALNLLEERANVSSFKDLEGVLENSRTLCTVKWHNLGGQLVSQDQLDDLEGALKSGKIDCWEDLHNQYKIWGNEYDREKLRHSAACWFEMTGKEKINLADLEELLKSALNTAEELFQVTRRSRERDFTDPFRQITFENSEEREAVLGRWEEDDFIKAQEEELSRLAIGFEELLHSVRRQG